MAGQAKHPHGGLLEFEPMLTQCAIPAWPKTGFHFELVAARCERRAYSIFEGINDARSHCENFPFFEGIFAAVLIPIKSGHQIRFDVGHHSDSMTAYPVVDRPRRGAAHPRERGTIPRSERRSRRPPKFRADRR